MTKWAVVTDARLWQQNSTMAGYSCHSIFMVLQAPSTWQLSQAPQSVLAMWMARKVLLRWSLGIVCCHSATTRNSQI